MERDTSSVGGDRYWPAASLLIWPTRRAGGHSGTYSSADPWTYGHGVWTEYENPWPVVLVVVGVTASVCALLPVAKSGVSLAWLALLPVGPLAIVPAVIAIGEQGRRPGSPSPDKSAQGTVLRFALGMASVGIVGCWIALTLDRGVILQVIGTAAGIGFLSIGTIAIGWYRGMRRSAPQG